MGRVSTTPAPRHLAEAVHRGRWLNLAAVATWLVCGLPPLMRLADADVGRGPATAFVASLLIYGAALLLLLYLPHGRAPGGRFIPLLLLVVESIAAMVVIYIGGAYLGGTGATAALIVIVAAQLPYLASQRWAWGGILLQTAVMSALFWRDAPLDELVSVTLAIGGFQVFAAASSMLALSEAAARAGLAQAHAELQAAQARLADNSRTEERLRISRDLHDALGHHLTALSLQLDVASRVADGKAAEHIARAHAVARLLLSDVRDVVSTLRESGPTDVVAAIRTVAGAAPLAVHVDAPATLALDDGDRAQALLRCVQEIITNASRHGHARNLWIRLEARPDGVALHARDDGRGSAVVSPGHGLTGMRERFAAFAGSVRFESQPGQGFEVHGFIPSARRAS